MCEVHTQVHGPRLGLGLGLALGLGLGRAPLVLPEVVAPEAVHRALDEDVVEDRVVAAVRLGVDVVDLPEAQFSRW